MGLSHTPSPLDEAHHKPTVAQLSDISPTEPRKGENDLRVSGRIQAPSHPLPCSVPKGNPARTTGSKTWASIPAQNPYLVLSSEFELYRAGTSRRVNSLRMSSRDHGPDQNAVRKATTAPAMQASTAPIRHDTVSLEAQDKDDSVG